MGQTESICTSGTSRRIGGRNMESYDKIKAIEGQIKHCKEKGYPYFAPNDGVCWDCNQQIYSEGKSRWSGRISKGISVERASSELITGCPHCNRSYCD